MARPKITLSYEPEGAVRELVEYFIKQLMVIEKENTGNYRLFDLSVEDFDGEHIIIGYGFKKETE